MLDFEAHMKTCPDCNGDGVVDKDTDDERQCPTCGGLGFVPDDDDDHEEVIKTSRDLPHSVTKRRRQTMKSILGVSLLILLMPSAYAASLPGDSADGKARQSLLAGVEQLIDQIALHAEIALYKITDKEIRK